MIITGILQFWFHDLTDATASTKIPTRKPWFNGGRKFDDEIREKS